MLVEILAQVCLRFYSSGDFDHLLDIDNEDAFKRAVADCGDGLLRFLLVELSTTEDCDDVTTAISRVESAIEDLNAVRRNLCEQNEEASYKISWVDGYGSANGKPEIHGIEWFTPALGFDEPLRDKISSLEVGKVIAAGGPADFVNIERLK